MLPGVGVAIAIAFVPVGVTPLGVMIEGVACGVPCGVPWGVWGVPGVCGVIAPGVIWLDGVSSHRLRRLLAEGVGVSWIKSPAPVHLSLESLPNRCYGQVSLNEEKHNKNTHFENKEVFQSL
jgi:hypothetical protein